MAATVVTEAVRLAREVSIRYAAKTCQIDRNTVRKYVRGQAAKPGARPSAAK